jgi:hypothetical protein
MRCRNSIRVVRKNALAFSVAELMVAISVMAIIVFALYHVFNQTQKAMRATEAQTDVSEKARAILDMVGREIEQTLPTFSSYYTDKEINFAGGPDYPPLVQTDERSELVKAKLSPTTPRTNFLENVFFQTRETNAYKALGYRVVDYRNGVGVLMRFQTTNRLGLPPMFNQFYTNFYFEKIGSTNYHQVADGVIHFKITPFDPAGYRLGYNTTNRYRPYYSIYRMSANGARIGSYSDVTRVEDANVVLQQGLPGTTPGSNEETKYKFLSNAVPAFVELELGILEPEALKQYYTMLGDNNTNVASKFLSQKINRVHLFRKRIALPTAAQ